MTSRKDLALAPDRRAVLAGGLTIGFTLLQGRGARAAAIMTPAIRRYASAQSASSDASQASALISVSDGRPRVGAIMVPALVTSTLTLPSLRSTASNPCSVLALMKKSSLPTGNRRRLFTFGPPGTRVTSSPYRR